MPGDNKNEEHNLSPKALKAMDQSLQNYDKKELSRNGISLDKQGAPTIDSIIQFAGNKIKEARIIGSELLNLGAKEERSASPKTVARSNSPTGKER